MRLVRQYERQGLDDVRRLGERVEKLDTHFRQAQDDVAGIKTSAGKITGRADRIGALEFEERAPKVAEAVPFPRVVKFNAAE